MIASHQIFIYLCALLMAVSGKEVLRRSTKHVSVLYDATYDVEGPACSGMTQPGNCPKAGAIPTGGCQPGALSYNPETKTCKLPYDSICTLFRGNVYGCVINVSPSAGAIPRSVPTSPYLIAHFDAKDAGGVFGVIKATYSNGVNPLVATVEVQLDMTDLDSEALRALYPGCHLEKMEFLWHLHVQWKNDHRSGFASKCGAGLTGGHYDPTFACGSASQYAKDVTCTAKTANSDFQYECSKLYNKTPYACEMGDFSSKFERLKPNDEHKLNGTYHDVFFPAKAHYNEPMYNQPKVQWNFILHLVCPIHKNPRVLCAKATLVDSN